MTFGQSTSLRPVLDQYCGVFFFIKLNIAFGLTWVTGKNEKIDCLGFTECYCVHFNFVFLYLQLENADCSNKLSIFSFLFFLKKERKISYSLNIMFDSVFLSMVQHRALNSHLHTGSYPVRSSAGAPKTCTDYKYTAKDRRFIYQRLCGF